jgi:hypothetical protein
MPIKINLLAEAQQIEDMRRRDPVKRFILAGVVINSLILVWSSSLMVSAIVKRGEVNGLESEAKAKEASYKQVLENQTRLIETTRQLVALNRLATNRFLIGNLMNALQTNTVDHVQLVRLKVQHEHLLTPEVKPERGSGRGIPKPATIKENITVELSAKDKSPLPGDGVSKLQEKLSKDAYFKSVLDRNGFRLTTLSPSQVDTDGKNYLLLGLEGRLPEKVR